MLELKLHYIRKRVSGNLCRRLSDTDMMNNYDGGDVDVNN